MRSRNSGEKQTAKAGCSFCDHGSNRTAMYALIKPDKSGLHCVVPEARLGVRQQIFGISMHAYAGMGITGLLDFSNRRCKAGGVLLMAVLPFWIYMVDRDAVIQTKKSRESEEIIVMPVNGSVEQLENAEDTVFAKQGIRRWCTVTF